MYQNGHNFSNVRAFQQFCNGYILPAVRKSSNIPQHILVNIPGNVPQLKQISAISSQQPSNPSSATSVSIRNPAIKLKMHVR
jgi:hypothetical protein